jgi:aminoglycoside/choline kinase family phosphotransferase
MDELKNFFISRFAKNLKPEHLTVEKLFGQASARQYFRVTVDPKVLTQVLLPADQGTYVVMKMPQGFASPAEEVTKVAKDAPKEFSFLNVQKYLKSLDLNVPAVLAMDDEKGLILLQDLGDRSLESLVKDSPKEFFVFYYKKVIDVLIDVQTKTLAHPTRDCISSYRFFTEDLLNWEFDHFLEYGIEDRFGVKVSEGARKVFTTETRKISQLIAEMPQGFVHRDFQSRNIMFRNYDFYLIDFQDALVGPVLYDLVGLLRDSYIEFTPNELHLLLEYYYEKLPAAHPYHGKLADVKADFHHLSLQRKLKDTGRFQFIKTVKNNPGFLPHVPLSLSYVLAAFASLPEYDGLRAMIAEYVGELR